MAKILIVDDDYGLRKIFGLCLEQVGLDVLFACDGDEGLQVAEAEQPDVMLLDFHMPGISGDKVLQVLRQTDWGRDMRVIAVTGDASRQIQHGMDQADLILYKPVEMIEMITMVQRLLLTAV